MKHSVIGTVTVFHNAVRQARLLQLPVEGVVEGEQRQEEPTTFEETDEGAQTDQAMRQDQEDEVEIDLQPSICGHALLIGGEKVDWSNPGKWMGWFNTSHA